MRWEAYATCRNGIDPASFFDKYESNVNTARVVDQMCLSCPVVKQCYEEGVENRSYGVWGGVFLKAGKEDRENNQHKTPDIWSAIREKQK